MCDIYIFELMLSTKKQDAFYLINISREIVHAEA